MKLSANIYRIALTLVVFVGLSTNAFSREIEGVHLREQITVEAIDDVLVLNGAGIRYKFFFKIYVGALYLTEKSKDAKAILNSGKANRIAMYFLYDEVDKEKMEDAWEDGFEDNLDDKAFDTLEDRLETFSDMFSTLHKGDAVLLDYIPGKGTRVMIKNDIKGTIEGADFNRALLSVWLGEDPVTEDLKEAMLGEED